MKLYTVIGIILPKGIVCRCGNTNLRKVRSEWNNEVGALRRSKHTWHCLICPTIIKTVHYGSYLETITWKRKTRGDFY